MRTWLIGVIRTLVLCFVVMSGASARSEAQQPSAVEATDSLAEVESLADAVDAAVVPTAATQPLPRRAPQPRTLHDFWPAFAVFAVLWVAMVIYVLPMGGSLRRVAERMLADENRRAGR